MATNFDLKIDINALDKIFDWFEKKIEWNIILWIRKWLNLLLKELKKNTPEDTKEMVNSYKILDVVKRWNYYIWTIWNTADHSIYVEFGVDWRIYDYHKPKWSTFYTWVWNRTFQRSLINAQDDIYKLIIESLW
jgi:hypothetical protein